MPATVHAIRDDARKPTAKAAEHDAALLHYVAELKVQLAQARFHRDLWRAIAMANESSGQLQVEKDFASSVTRSAPNQPNITVST